MVDERFRIEERIGAGGMGVVYRAHDQLTGGPVAIKVIHANTAEEILRATREIETLAAFDHPSIVRHIKDGLTSTDQLYLAMAWIDGITVADRLETDGFSLREAAELGHSVALGLAAAHATQILHRDIKPTNIMLEGGDPARAKLIDFGLARVAGAAHKSVTRTGITVGTPGYMSPEQARGVRMLTAASDVFNLGLIVYECATGRPAFHGPNLAALLVNIVLADPVPLSIYCPEAPPALEAFVRRCLAKDPRQRPRDGAAVAAELAQLLSLGIPDRPRRDSHRLIDGKTLVTPSVDPPPQVEVHCLVLASRGFLDDYLEPPTEAELAIVHAAAAHAGATAEVIATGTLAVHISGTPADASHRAAEVALNIAGVLKSWTMANLDRSPRAERRVRRGHRAAHAGGQGGAVRAREAARRHHDRSEHREADRGHLRRVALDAAAADQPSLKPPSASATRRSCASSSMSARRSTRRASAVRGTSRPA